VAKKIKFKELGLQGANAYFSITLKNISPNFEGLNFEIDEF